MEYSRLAKENDVTYYPVNTKQDQLKYNQYREMAETESRIIFGGRLGEYMYYDMHQVIGSALSAYQNKVKIKLTNNIN